jgi:hypothetical protein
LEKPITRHVKDHQKLLVAKRILNGFNSGNIDEIKEIILESIPQDCEVNLTALNIKLMGGASIFILMNSLMEAIPNGCFRTSDTIVDDEGKVIIRFAFSGIKLYEMTFELWPAFLRPESTSMKSEEGKKSNMDIEKSSEEAISSGKSSADTTLSDNSTDNKDDNYSIASIDRTRALLDSMRLLVEKPRLNNYRGVVAMRLDENCKITGFDVNWKEVDDVGGVHGF